MSDFEANSLAIEDVSNPQSVSYTPEPKEVKPPTAREAIEKSLSALEETNGKIPEVPERDEKKEPAKVDPKAKVAEPAKVEDKPVKERQPDGKFVSKAEQPIADENDAPEPVRARKEGDGPDIHRPPERFLPRAKEQWATIPDDVKGEVHRALSGMEKGLEEYRESHEFRKELRQFEELAKASNVTVKQALENYTAIDRELKSNPEAGLAKVFKAAGIDPIAYAKHILGQQQQMQANPALAQTQRLEQQVQQLTQHITQLTQGQQQAQQEAAKTAQITEIENKVINPFRESLGENDRYEELQGDIEFFLNSGKIPFNLSAQQRLEAAYDMAERINPAPNSRNTRNAQRPINPAGVKSIKGSLTTGTEVHGGKGSKLNARDSLEAAFDQLGIH